MLENLGEYRENLERARTGNQYSRVREKIHNSALNNDAAWQEAQELFAKYVIDGPTNQFREEYADCLEPLRNMFNIRRDAYINRRDLTDEERKEILEIGEKAGPLLTKPAIALSTLLFYKVPDTNLHRRR